MPYAKPNGIVLRLDGFLPGGTALAPAVIIVHGGGWVGGDRRTNVEPLFEPLSTAGFAWFSISYRLATNVTDFGAAIDDVQAAIRFVTAHAAEYNLDATRISVIGESAGGQLAAMAILRGGNASVQALVGFYTPFDLVALAKSSDYVPSSIRAQITGTPWEGFVLAGLAQLSPINNVHSGMPPVLLIHGSEDRLVPFTQSAEMCKRVQNAGGTCEVFAVKNAGHGIRWWAATPAGALSYKTKIVDWLRAQPAVRP